MGKLCKADLRRVLKDKLLLVLLLLAVVFSLITPLLYAAIFSIPFSAEDPTLEPMLGSLISAKGQFFQSFSMTNNMGLIAPVLLAIVLCKDFSFGTVRNKIISGKRRSSIFLSMFFVCALVLCAVMFLSAFISMGISLFFFEYQSTPFTAADFGYFMASLGFELLVVVFMAALLSWLCACGKNAGTAIVLYVAITFGLMMLGGIVQMVAIVLDGIEGYQTLTDAMLVLDRLNVCMSINYIGTGSSYSWQDVAYLTLPPLAGIVGFLSLGVLGFRKKDLK